MLFFLFEATLAPQTLEEEMHVLSYSNNILQNNEGTLDVFKTEGFLILEV